MAFNIFVSVTTDDFAKDIAAPSNNPLPIAMIKVEKHCVDRVRRNARAIWLATSP